MVFDMPLHSEMQCLNDSGDELVPVAESLLSSDYKLASDPHESSSDICFVSNRRLP